MEIADIQPGYTDLFKSGELQKRTDLLEAHLSACDICPRKCGVNRLKGEFGFCRSGYLPVVSSVCDHHGEEPALSGTRGSGTIFFTNCNMHCVYCQNYQISQGSSTQEGTEKTFEALSNDMLFLQNELGCHNINLVSPTHFVPQIVKSILLAIPRGLKIPVVYNTNGYDSLEIIKLLDGIVDIYLPDLRYASNEMAQQFSAAMEYVQYAKAAIMEMYRQVGNLKVDKNEIAVKGLIIRHLILPNDIAGSKDSLRWISRNLSADVTLSIMSQYYPAYKASLFPLLSRAITEDEYYKVEQMLDDMGLGNGWMQQFGTDTEYMPDFSREGHPFINDEM
jgi:putative pyruvate formate lyase activating enzyme